MTLPATERAPGLRGALLDQTLFLAEEAAALQSMIVRLPAAVLETQPIPGELSVKEMYALLLGSDEQIHLPFVDALLQNAAPNVQRSEPDALIRAESWNQVPIADILVRLAESRRRLVARCEAASEEAWSRTGVFDGEAVDLFAFLFNVVQHDVEILRLLGERLHEARLSERLVGP